MEKVYCSLCRYCDDDYSSIDYCRCYHPKYLTDTFYGKAWDTPYCDRKNKNNNCSDFEAHPKVIRKQKRRAWFNNLKNTLYDKARTGALRCRAFLSEKFKIGSSSSSES